MNREQAREIVTASYRAGLQRDKNGKGYICPFCGSGTGEKGTGITENPKAEGRFTCWAGCFSNASAFDLIACETGLITKEEIGKSLPPEAFTEAYKRYNITIDDNTKIANNGKSANMGNQTKEANSTNEADKKQEEPEKKHYNRTAYYNECAGRIDAAVAQEYLHNRGISKKAVEHYHIGFDPHHDNGIPRIIVPVDDEFYIARRIDGEDKIKKYYNLTGVPVKLFNAAALYDEENTAPLFVAEGTFNAIAIYEAGGGDAIGLNGTSHRNKLLELLQKKKTKRTLILCLDNDEAGQNAEKDLYKGLQEMGIKCLQYDIISKEYDDPNERLVSDREGLENAIQAAIRAAAKPDNVQDYLTGVLFNDLDYFKGNGNRKTGFKKLDQKMNGIYTGLYCLAATSSLGKTTIMHQIADQMAAAGDDVLYFSLEQSRLELITKSFARLLYQKTFEPNSPTSLDLRKSEDYEALNLAAGLYYKMVGDRLSIIEGNFDFNVFQIVDYVKQYISNTGIRPVVIIDYLQILKGNSDKSLREQTDEIVTTLKRLSRNEDVPVFIISSINRMSYLSPVSFESLKESGGIEYSCDCILGLNLRCVVDETTQAGKEFENAKTEKQKKKIAEREKSAIPRSIQLSCIKNRYGITSFYQNFYYDPVHDYLSEE